MADQKILDILEAGLAKARQAKNTFKEPGGQEVLQKPFFVSLSLRDSKEYIIEVLNGAVMNRTPGHNRNLRARLEMRMGDYELGGGKGTEAFVLPKDLGINASQHKIWVATQDAFWACARDYGKRNLTAMGITDKREKYQYFSREEPRSFAEEEKKLEVDLDYMADLMRQASSKLLDDGLFSSEIDFFVNNENRYVLNSEGSRVFSSFLKYSIVLTLRSADSKNRIIPHMDVIHCLKYSELPSLETILEKGEKLKEELSEIVKAPIQKNGSYPVLMDPYNHGVLWHEVIGHALEGHRMQDDSDEDDWDSGKVTLFLGKIGHKVAPHFISLYDDPTAENMDGSYAFDDEGVQAQKVTLIENGVLKNYLHSRSSAAFFNTRSNGHARASNGNDPVARMTNLFIKSSNEVPFEQLRENLIRECERQKEDYGLMFFKCAGGLTLPEECHFETYPSRVYRVYRDGKTEQVRGIYVVGTPYQAMKHVLQTSDDYQTFRGYCGAESGSVPSTETTPHALLRSLEVAQIPEDSYEELKDIVVPKFSIAP